VTREQLLQWVRGLGPHDLSVAVALSELVSHADDIGSAGRDDWLAWVREAYEGTAAARVDGSGFPMTTEQGEPVGRYLEEQVIARLEAAGIATRELPHEGSERVRVEPDLWEEIRLHKPEIVQELRGVVRVLHGGVALSPAAAPVVVPPTGGSRLRAQGLVKVYRNRKVVNEVAISVSQGEIVGLLGPNGAGKTTTFYMIVGLISPDAGRVYLDEADITETPMYQRARRGVGYLAQEPSIFRKLTVEENVRAILETLRLPKQEEHERLEELLDELSIAHLRKNRAYSLSGGERRRLEITRALVQRPKFILLDEPFAGIDPIAVGDIQHIVSELKGRGIGVIISDHNVEQTLEIVDRAYIMYEGGIRVSGTVSELVWSDEVAEIYLGPTLTARMRRRYPRPVAALSS
jgi:lipopolysaccharide export system ATP-binding protein